MWPRILRGLFVVYAVATALHIGWVVHHEPFGFDAWNVAVDTRAEPITVSRFFNYWWFEYTHSNPRFGQALTYLSYKLEYFAVIATPLAYLAVSLAITVLGLGRWPWRRGRDLALWSIAIGALWFSLPQIGKTLFCRAYCANYIYGLAIQLWLLVALRLARNPRAVHCVAYGAFGVVAGMCNEHTGPTLCAFLVGYAWWCGRRNSSKVWFARAGALGAALGFAAIFFAPGQGERYSGLAQRVSLFGRLLGRGVTGNVEIVRDLMLGVAPILGLIAIVAAIAIGRSYEPSERDAARAAVRQIMVALIAALAMAVTLFVSPKLGPRFYYASSSLLLAGWVALAGVVLTPRQLGPIVVFAAAASIYAVAHTVPMYGRLARASDQRMAELAHAPRGSVYIAQAFEQIDETWWFYGDDFRDVKKRHLVATYFGLAGVALDAYDRFAPLGSARAYFAPKYTVEPPDTDHPHELGLPLSRVAGHDMVGLHHEIQTAIALLRARLQPAKLVQFDVEVRIDSPRVPLPPQRLLVGRWREGVYESYVAKISRKPRTRTRIVAIPKQLMNTEYEIFIYLVGGEAKRLGGTGGEPLQFVPWQSGLYWILACRSDECFVLLALPQGG